MKRPVLVLAAATAVLAVAVVRFLATPRERAPGEARVPDARNDEGEAATATPEGVSIAVTPTDTGERAAVDASARVGGDEKGARSTDHTPDELEERIVRVAQSFLGDAPELEAWKRVLRELADRATVVADSVVTDDPTGLVTGELAFDGIELTGEFTIDGAHSSVEIQAAEAGESDFVARSLGVGFTSEFDSIVGGEMSVQFHPRVDFLSDDLVGATRRIGWTLGVDGSEGTVATPIHASRSEDLRSLRIGTDSGETLRMEWDWQLADYDAWRRVLADR